MVVELIRNLVLTIFVEGIVVYIMYKRKDILGYSLVCNLLTNPILNLILFALMKWGGFENYIEWVGVFEMIVVLAEASVYQHFCGLTWKKGFWLSVIANVASYGMGILLQSLGIF